MPDTSSLQTRGHLSDFGTCNSHRAVATSAVDTWLFKTCICKSTKNATLNCCVVCRDDYFVILTEWFLRTVLIDPFNSVAQSGHLAKNKESNRQGYTDKIRNPFRNDQ